MRKKEEFESARLMDFAFRERARATRFLARFYDLDEGLLVREIAVRNEDGVLDLVARQTGREEREIAAAYQRCPGAARRELIAERGDPTPYRLG